MRTNLSSKSLGSLFTHIYQRPTLENDWLIHTHMRKLRVGDNMNLVRIRTLHGMIHLYLHDALFLLHIIVINWRHPFHETRLVCLA